MKIAVILTARASWAKLEPVCRALTARPDVELQIIACASALLERYGRVVDVVKEQGYEVAAEVWSTYEGANLITSAAETGALLTALSGTLHALRPDVGVVCADRHEVLACAQSLSYLHVPLVHLQGGERTGSIDDKVRDGITHLADYHCVSTPHAQMRVYSLTGSDQVYLTGCPSIDIAHAAVTSPPVTMDELGGSGPRLDLAHPFLLVLQHSVTNEADVSGWQMQQTLEAVGAVPLPRIVLWPGEDAGQEALAKAIRVWKDERPELAIHTVRNLPPMRFLRLLMQCAALVGNSSAGIREGSYLGVPVVNIVTRQQGRERGPNVRDVPYDIEAIWSATIDQVNHGPYPRSGLYGRGDAGERIAEVICGNTGGGVAGLRVERGGNTRAPAGDAADPDCVGECERRASGDRG